MANVRSQVACGGLLDPITAWIARSRGASANDRMLGLLPSLLRLKRHRCGGGTRCRFFTVLTGMIVYDVLNSNRLTDFSLTNLRLRVALAHF